MNFKNMTDTFKEVAAQYKTDMDVAREYIHSEKARFYKLFHCTRKNALASTHDKPPKAIFDLPYAHKCL